MNPALVDTHCHPDLEHYHDDRPAMFDRMADAGVVWAVAVGIELATLPRLRALAESRAALFFSVGIHPNHDHHGEITADELAALARHEKCVAIGETGLDFFRHRIPEERQRQMFATHIAAAKLVGKPVIVHNRDADAACLDVMRAENIGDCGGVMHCFSADWPTAKEALDLGLYISFSGNVTFKKNAALREVAAQIPADRILIETDAPYLAPEPWRGQRNEPAYMVKTAETLAAVRGVTLAEFARQTTENARGLFAPGV